MTEKTYKLVNGDRSVVTNDKEFAKEFLCGVVLTGSASAPSPAFPAEAEPTSLPSQAAEDGKGKGKGSGRKGGYRQPIGDLEVTQTDTAFVISYPSGKRQVAKPMVTAAADALRRLYVANGGKPMNCKELHEEIAKSQDPAAAAMSLSTVVTGIIPIFKKIGVIDHWYGKRHELLIAPKAIKKPEPAAPVEVAEVAKIDQAHIDQSHIS